MTKRKCGETLFVYQSDGSDKTLTTINDAIPHTCNMQNGVAECSQPYIYKK